MNETTAHRVVAFNTATASTNKIHDDVVARSYGFGGGLVPGVDVYAYMTHLPAARWGRSWLESGSMTARFDSPVYDGEAIAVTATAASDAIELVLSGDAGDVRASGVAALTVARRDRAAIATAQLPDVRPVASADSLRPGTVLGSLTEVFRAAQAAQYLADVRESLPLYAAERIAHPGWLLRRANTILARNVELGPWIHVSSDVTLLGVVSDGDVVETSAVVVDEGDRKGHRFVTLDVSISCDRREVQRITHTAIHTPRRRRPLER